MAAFKQQTKNYFVLPHSKLSQGFGKVLRFLSMNFLWINFRVCMVILECCFILFGFMIVLAKFVSDLCKLKTKLKASTNRKQAGSVRASCKIRTMSLYSRAFR